MQNYLLTLSLLLLGLFTQAQTPEAFNYQAVVRDAGGQILSNQEVGLQVSLIADTTIVYVEIHSATTNSFGLVNLAIGRGTVDLGQFDTLDWSQAMFIQIGLDVSGGGNYLEMGTAELLSVPYALYATGGGTAELPNDPQPGDIVYFDSTAWQRLPAGEAGAVLTMGPDGLPVWKKIPSILDSLLTINLPNGETIYAYPEDNELEVAWGPEDIDINDLPNIQSFVDAEMDFAGEENTEKIVNALGDNFGLNYAAKICYELEAFGFDDWYLPAAGELNEFQRQYGRSFPLSEVLPSYWSSTESSSSQAWSKEIIFGGIGANDKKNRNRCRCVRK